MKKLTKNHPSARWMIFFGLLPPTAQVQCGKNGGFGECKLNCVKLQ